MGSFGNNTAAGARPSVRTAIAVFSALLMLALICSSALMGSIYSGPSVTVLTTTVGQSQNGAHNIELTAMGSSIAEPSAYAQVAAAAMEGRDGVAEEGHSRGMIHHPVDLVACFMSVRMYVFMQLCADWGIAWLCG